MMKMLKKALFLAFAGFALISCNNAAKMAEMAEQVSVVCTPEVLEVVAGQIDADVAVSFPEGYFYKKAILEVTPVIKYEGGEVVGQPFMYQGEKVTDNYKVVSNAGGTIKEHVNFAYVKGMEKSTLVARAKVLYKGKEYAFPEDIKIADGANTTYMLVCKKGSYHMMADKYQEVIPEEVEAQVLYLINSATVRPSQLKSDDVKEYQAAVKNVMNDERRTIKGTDIVAYASPDGPEDNNNKLSDNRGKSAEKAFSKVSKKLETGAVSTKSIGEDWEGFQELVAASSIEDKDLIIRVLSMYSDPNVREREIKNMSSVYSTLAKNVLPELRRARFITNVEFQNYTAEELLDLLNNNIDVLDEEALLRVATLVKDNNAKYAAYNKAIAKYNSDRAKYNTAVLKLDENKDAEAKAMLDKMTNKSDCCVNNLYGVIAMRAGDNAAALKYFAKVSCGDGRQNEAVIDILNGKYADAAKKLAGTKSVNEGLAYILTKDLNKASSVLNGAECEGAAYQRAIVAARKGDAAKANSELKAASKCDKLAERAKNDVEFAKVK